MRTARDQRVQRAISVPVIMVALSLISGVKAAATAEQIDQSNLPPWAGGWTHVNPTGDGQATMWQIFTPGRPGITAVEIDILTVSPGLGDDTLTVEIAQDGQLLASADRSIQDGFDGLLRFDFPVMVSVVPEQLHELRVRDTGKTRFGWKYASNTYDRGSRYVNANERPNTDWFFQTYSPVAPRIIYVDDDAAGANDGSSWANAYTFLQEALAAAKIAEKPVEIRVAQGIYKPNQGLVAIPEFDWRTATFQLINGVVLKGGYAGLGQPDPNARNVELYETILSGDLYGDDEDVADPRDLSDEPTRAENSYHVVTGSGTDATAVLAGFTVTAGNADGSGSNGYGGGVYNHQGNLMLANCAFAKNSGIWGGGMCSQDSSPQLINCAFSENWASSHGGGLCNIMSNPTVIDCTFMANVAFWRGGGITYITSTASGRGGPIVPPGYVADSESSLHNCVFSGNSAYGGGAIGNNLLRMRLFNCVFSGNAANTDRGGAISNYSPGETILTNCTISGNRAANYAGGIYGGGGDLTFINNCIVWANTAGIPNDVSEQIQAVYNIDYSCIQGSVDTRIQGQGNIVIDPCFANPGHWNPNGTPDDPNAVWVGGDYHLKSQAGRWDPVSGSWVIDAVTSPCIDAGDPNSPVGDEPEPNGGRINMGAYGGTAEASKSYTSWWFVTTGGPVVAEGLGIVLPHEHIFTDLRGPTTPGYGQADPADVVRVMAPLLTDARRKGVGVMIECSSIGVGRNAPIVAQVAETAGLPVVVPTGVYGRANFAPPEHRAMTEDELTALFTDEIRNGIEGTGIKAGFIKIATDNGPMTALEEKFLRAAGRAASQTGAAIASHTPIGSNAVRQTDILQSIDPAIRFIWVHAQNESNRSLHRQLAARGVFIEFDSLGWNPGQDSTFIAAIKDLLAAGHADRILLSHDAGWYQPGQRNGGTQKPYTYLIDAFVRKLRSAGVDDATIRLITETNPIRAFGFTSN